MGALTTTAASAADGRVGGAAFGASASGLITLAPTPTVTLPLAGTPQSATAANVNALGLLSTGAVTVTTGATGVGTAAEQVQSQAQVAAVNTSLVALTNVVNATTVTSSCTSNASGSSGTTSLVGLSLLGVPVALPATIPANFGLTCRPR